MSNTEKKPLNQIENMGPINLGKYLIDSNFCLPTISNDGLWNLKFPIRHHLTSDG